ncbi:MAG: phytanoyl-CoA dioxygenase family protein [Pseudomonadota bacterium]
MSSGAQPLSAAQISQYFEQGYLVLPGLIDGDSLATYNQRFLDLVGGAAPLADEMKIMQDVMIVKGAVEAPTPVHAVNKLLCLENDAALFDFARHPALVAAVQSLLGPSLFSLSSNVFNKPPGVDGRHPMHQDLRYFRLRPADKIVGVWTAMLPAHRQNGCLAVIPGSHKLDLLAHANPDWDYVNHGFYGIAEDDARINFDTRIHVEMRPGDTLLFHPLLVHGSGTNESADFRRAISVHYAAGDCQSDRPDWQTRGLTRHIA